MFKKNSFCRVCKKNNLQKVLSLGSMPPANAFLAKEGLSKPEPSFPLELYFCNDCGFVQLLDIVSPELLFKNYVYVSSTSPSFVEHFRSFAETVTNRFNFPSDSLIVDIGSNDGILLRPFKKLGWQVLGVDPAVKIAEMATKNGIETIAEFFTPEIAKKIAKERGHASIVTATSVFSHIDDLDNLVAGIKELLADNGIFIIEAYYLVDLLEKNLFDTIYHEHLSYFTVTTLNKLFERLGMKIFDVEKTDTHGGSLRIFVQKNNSNRPIQEKNINAFMGREKQMAMDKALTYINFSKNIEKNKQNLTELLKELKSQGKRIIGYGAPAKGNTLLNYFKIGPELLDYVVDDSPWKQGLYTPGMRLLVVSSEEISKNKPDYILILAWNFAGPIMEKYSRFHKEGGKFIIPVPEPKII